ncbi:hypothetical protein [Nostoc sp.]|uniref:hypothetical protein n=1 Tax=Nostoc sp. TaxID=1180 RepID=UPI002FFB07C7
MTITLISLLLSKEVRSRLMINKCKLMLHLIASQESIATEIWHQANLSNLPTELTK